MHAVSTPGALERRKSCRACDDPADRTAVVRCAGPFRPIHRGSLFVPTTRRIHIQAHDDAVLTAGHARHPQRAEAAGGVSAGGGGGRRERRRQPATAASSTAATSPLVTHRSGRSHGPGPGHVRGAHRRRLPRLLRHRRCRRLRQPGRSGRPRGAPAWRDAVRRQREDPAASEGAVRRRGVAAARSGAPGAAVDDRAGRAPAKAWRSTCGARWCGIAPGSITKACSSRSTPAHADPMWAVLQEIGELRRAARAGARWREPAVAGAGDRRGGWPLDAVLPRAHGGGGLERADLAADRHGGGAPDGAGQGGAAAHLARSRSAGARRLHITARGLRHRLARRPRLSRLHPLARSVQPRPTWPCSPPAPRCCAVPATPPSTARCPSSRCIRRWLRPTRMPPRRCGGWSIAIPARSAWPCARASRCRDWVLSALAGVAGHHAGIRPSRAPVREGGARPCRSRGAGAARGRSVSGGDRRGLRQGSPQGTVIVSDPAVEAGDVGGQRPAAGRGGQRAAGHGRPRNTGDPLRTDR